MPTQTPGAIVADHILAVQAIWFAWMLEEVRMFQVVERLALLFAQGLLPIEAPATRRSLVDAGFHNARLTAQDRASLYTRALGAPGGEAGHAQPNDELLSLWFRFLVAVTAYAGKHSAATLLAPPSPHNADVRQAARALAANATAHGGGLTRTMAAKLLAEVHAAIDLLGCDDVLEAFGARDAWQVIDLVNRKELGGARNVARVRAEATAGSRVLRWLAEHADLLDVANAADRGVTPEAQALVEAASEVILLNTAPPEPDAVLRPPPREASGGKPRPALERATRDLLDATGLPPRTGTGDSQDADAAVAVFHGDRRSGKTLAAYQLAHALGKNVVRVDLSQVASGALGEVEKHLDAVFRQAEESGAVLLLDEADALFGRRTDVNESHDRYANLDIADLLQRAERHSGPVILATNRKDDIDAAFTRRLRAVRFPRPPEVVAATSSPSAAGTRPSTP